MPPYTSTIILSNSCVEHIFTSKRYPHIFTSFFGYPPDRSSMAMALNHRLQRSIHVRTSGRCRKQPLWQTKRATTTWPTALDYVDSTRGELWIEEHTQPFKRNILKNRRIAWCGCISWLFGTSVGLSQMEAKRKGDRKLLFVRKPKPSQVVHSVGNYCWFGSDEYCNEKDCQGIFPSMVNMVLQIYLQPNGCDILNESGMKLQFVYFEYRGNIWHFKVFFKYRTTALRLLAWCQILRAITCFWFLDLGIRGIERYRQGMQVRTM